MPRTLHITNHQLNCSAPAMFNLRHPPNVSHCRAPKPPLPSPPRIGSVPRMPLLNCNLRANCQPQKPVLDVHSTPPSSVSWSQSMNGNGPVERHQVDRCTSSNHQPSSQSMASKFLVTPGPASRRKSCDHASQKEELCVLPSCPASRRESRNENHHVELPG